MKRLTVTHKITNINNESFKQYLKEVSEIETFTPQEEIECSIKASQGDENAIKELTKRNLRFVISVAKQYTTDTLILEDLVNEGNIGLIMAIQKFKPEMGYKFISYAVWWIRKVILEYIANNGKLIRIPANKINSLNHLEKKIVELEQANGYRPDINQLCEALGNEMTYKDVSLLEKINTLNFSSLDMKIGGDDSDATLGELISDDTYGGSDHIVTKSDISFSIENMLGTLKPREKFIMEAFFGLNGQEQMTMNEIGSKLDLSGEMVRQIKVKTLSKLKNKMRNSSLLSDYYA